jgi:hypothetical protein
MSKTREEIDNEEAYWFTRWCQLRVENRRLKKHIEELAGVDALELKKENSMLKNTLTQIRSEYAPQTAKKKVKVKFYKK